MHVIEVVEIANGEVDARYERSDERGAEKLERALLMRINTDLFFVRTTEE